ncbi:MAG: F0F1 ATP synthase subunit B [Flavobacteriaceae bacterium]|tara:strand:- start:23964 stop:24464 length:501 start_codon:yes stop_codon:yes gene_type:complete
MDKLINEFSFGLFFWQLLIFVGLILILKKFAWKPILDTLNERENSIKESLESAQKAKDEFSKIKADNDKILSNAKKERDFIISDAKKTGREIIEDSKNAAKLESEKIIENARESIIQEKDLILKDLKSQVVDISVEIASKILQKELNEKQKQEDYTQKLIDQIEIK